MWEGRSTRAVGRATTTMSRPSASAGVGDVDGTLNDDVLWHASPDHEDAVWKL